jgi:hypothetical protein
VRRPRSSYSLRGSGFGRLTLSRKKKSRCIAQGITHVCDSANGSFDRIRTGCGYMFESVDPKIPLPIELAEEFLPNLVIA